MIFVVCPGIIFIKYKLPSIVKHVFFPWNTKKEKHVSNKTLIQYFLITSTLSYPNFGYVKNGKKPECLRIQNKGSGSSLGTQILLNQTSCLKD
jgi:hypothetical protein